MEQKIKRYFEVKAMVAELNAELNVIRGDVKAVFGDVKADLTIGEELVRIQTKTRANKRCDWAAFKAINEELYEQVVAESESSYIELRKIVNG